MRGELFSALVDLDRDLVRNIKSLRVSQDLFDDLSADETDWRHATNAEARARRHQSTKTAVIQRPFDYGTVITFPFFQANWQATRYSDGLEYGVWYGSLALKTTLYETVYHWVRFIRDAFADYDAEIIGERRAFKVRCQGLLADLRGKHETFVELIDPDDYTFTHRVGRYAVDQRLNGLLVQSARCDGVNAAVFRAGLLSAVRDLCFLTYRYRLDSPVVRVERQPGRTYVKVPVSDPLPQAKA